MLPPSQRKQLEILGFGQFPCLLVNLLQIPRCLTQIRRLFVGPDQICHLCQQLPVFATRTLLWLLLANKNPAQKAGMRKQLLASRFINMIFENDKKNEFRFMRIIDLMKHSVATPISEFQSSRATGIPCQKLI